MPHHPFRFGVNVYGANSRTEWIAKAQHIEALGYDTCFVADHCVGIRPRRPCGEQLVRGQAAERPPLRQHGRAE